MQYALFLRPASLCCLLGWLTLSPLGHCQHLTIALSHDAPPYVMQQGQSGLQVEILTEALAHRGHTYSVIQVSAARLHAMVTEGMADAAVGGRRQPDGTYYSENFIGFENVVVTRADQQLQIGSVEDLKPLHLAAWQNAYRDLSPAFFAAYNPHANSDKQHFKRYFEVPKQLSQVKMFWAGHVDAVVIDRYIFEYISSQLRGSFDTGHKVVYHELFEPLTHFQVNFVDRQLRDDFNQGLRQLKSSGRYAELQDKYLSNSGSQDL